MALFAGLDPGLLHSIGLQKPVEVLLRTPSSAVVVKLDSARLELADCRVFPVGKLDRQARNAAAEKLRGSLDRRRQRQPVAGGPDRFRIPDLGFDVDNVADLNSPPMMCWGSNKRTRDP